MPENLAYRIVFLRGSLAGKTHALAAGAGTTAGRSRACEIRLAEPDVSGRHVLFTVSSRGVTLENLSSRVTRADGAAMALGQTLELRAGAVVELGTGVEFTLESVEAAAAGAAPETRANPATQAPATRGTSAHVATTPPATQGAATPKPPRADAPGPATNPGNEPPQTGADYSPATQAQMTILARPEDLEELRGLHVRRRRVKAGALATAGGLALAGLTVLYLLFVNRPPEQELTIQKDGSGRAVRADAFMDPEARSLCLSHPAARQATVRRADNSLTVDAWVGRDSDVPLRLELHWFTPPGNAALDTTRAESFAAWCAQNTNLMTAAVMGSLNALPENGFIGKRHGIPCLRFKYRRDRDDSREHKNWTGLLAFFRNGDTCYAYLCELPVQEEFRGSRLIQIPESFLIVPDAFVEEYWEGRPAAERDGRGAAELQREWTALVDVGKATEWDRIERYVTSALIQLWPRREAERDACAAALKALRDHRANKQLRIQRLLVRRIEAASLRDDRLGAAIDREARDLFSSQEDARHYRVRVENWWEDSQWRE